MNEVIVDEPKSRRTRAAESLAQISARMAIASLPGTVYGAAKLGETGNAEWLEKAGSITLGTMIIGACAMVGYAHSLRMDGEQRSLNQSQPNA